MDPSINAWYLLPCAALFAILFTMTRARARSILAPAPLWNLSWATLFTVGALLGQAYNYTPSSTLLLFLLAMSFNVVPLLASYRTPGAPDRARVMVASASAPWQILLVTAIIGLAGALDMSARLGTPLLSAESLAAVLDAGKSNAAQLYRDDIARSTFGTVAYAVLQFGFAALGARMRVHAGRATWLLLAINLVAAASWTAVTTQRSYFLVQILWFASGYVAAAVASSDEQISPRVTAFAAVGTAALAIFVVAARAIRLAGADAQLSNDSLAGSQLWAAGYIPTFSEWHAAGGGAEHYPLRLLSGALSLIGVEADDGTLADGENFTYIGAGQTSNAATMMRAVVLSAGEYGAFLVVITLGALSTWIYVRARMGHAWAVAAYSGTVATILWSVNAWHFTNANRVLAQALLCVLLAAAVRHRSREGQHAGRRPGPRRGKVRT